jgi:cation:H+ antiporter
VLTYLLFVAGFIILIKGAAWLVDGSASVARRFGISEIVVGLTIVSMGTSTPELVVSVFSSLKGNPEIVVGNVVGSNIVNILFILGLSAVIFPLTVKKNTTYKEIPFALLSALIIMIMGGDTLFDFENSAVVTTGDGLVLLGFFAIFMYYIFAIAKQEPVPGDKAEVLPLWKSVVMITLGLIALVFGGRWIVDGATEIAMQFGVSNSLIGLTVVAIGTSLPELATSAVAAYKKNTDIAIGNVVGSNIFNAFFILGVSSLIQPVPVLPRNIVDFAMNILASVLLFVFLFIGKRHILERWQGAAFIMIYVAYIVYLVKLG